MYKDQEILFKRSNATAFPVESFPNSIKEYILKSNQSLNFPIDYISCSIMVAVSTAIGNSIKLKVKNSWTEKAVLFMALVGRQGANKSAPMKSALKPISELDSLKYKQYLEDRKNYDGIIEMSKSERENKGVQIPEIPVYRKTIISDHTPEVIPILFKNNTRGVLSYTDELTSWFKTFNRYNSGSEESFWLELWSNAPINVDRKGSDSIHVDEPFINVTGSIQKSILRDLTGGSRSDNGFLDRILFSFPDEVKKPLWSDEEMPESLIENYFDFVNRIIDIDLNSEILLVYDDDAKEEMKLWVNSNTEEMNESDDDQFRGLCAKLETYFHRLAIIVHVMDKVESAENVKSAIQLDSVKRVIPLIEYFKQTALKVREFTSNPFADLSEDKINLYNQLEEVFETSNAIDLAEQHSIKKRSVYLFLNNQKYFTRLKHGKYKKKI